MGGYRTVATSSQIEIPKPIRGESGSYGILIEETQECVYFSTEIELYHPDYAKSKGKKYWHPACAKYEPRRDSKHVLREAQVKFDQKYPNWVYKKRREDREASY